MSIDFVKKYKAALAEILFFRFYSEKIKSLSVVSRYLLYAFTSIFYYAPVIFGIVTLFLHDKTYVPYLISIIVLHIASRFMFVYTKTIQLRFYAAKKNRKFIIRILLVLEYVLCMWLVYLFFPITCVTFPISMILIASEKLIGFSFFLTLLATHTEQFIFYGGLVAYVLFIFIDGYKRMLTGLMPAYLRIYAVITVMSGTISALANIIYDILPDHIESAVDVFSHIFGLSNHALNIVSTFVMFAYAIFSLYTTCGLDPKSIESTETESSE